MALVVQTQSELGRLISPCHAPQQLDVAASGQRLIVELTGLDSLGCAFTHFELRSDRLATAAIDELKKVAEQLARRVTYLLESIQPIEIDRDACVVQMRSVPPTTDDGQSSYYELHVRRGGVLTLCRYARRAGQAREVIPAQLTREVFARLLRDFSEVA